MKQREEAGKLSPGHQIYEVARDGDTAKVTTLLSRQGAQSFINYQDARVHAGLHRGRERA